MEKTVCYKQTFAGITNRQSNTQDNSGVWIDYKMERQENQKKCILPMNDVSATIFYNQRIALSADIKEPVVWRCTKVEQISPKGIDRLTFAQDVWDQHHDYVERDSEGKLIGIWCNYWDYNIEPEVFPEDPEPEGKIYSRISYSGTKPQLKSGGSYKKFTVTFYKNEETIATLPGTWSYLIDGVDVSDKLLVVTNAEDSSLKENQVKVKFKKDDTYIGKVLVISYASDDGVSSSVEIEIAGL